jgi:hypothetical protein
MIRHVLIDLDRRTVWCPYLIGCRTDSLGRNLFSVGFGEIGLLVAGRGLEGVLRRVAQDGKIFMQPVKGKPRPANEVDFADLV